MSVNLSIMAQGGFDIVNAEKIEHGAGSGIDPLSLMLVREQHIEYLSNPCNGCVHEDSTDPYVLDYCHYTCDNEDIVPLVDELTDN